MNFLQHNNLWLRQVDSALCERVNRTAVNQSFKVTPARSGTPTLRIGSIQIHSAYDPVREAESMAEKSTEKLSANDVIVIFGLGLGYLTEEVRKRFDGKIILIEPDLSVVKLAMNERSMGFLSSMTLVLGQSLQETVNAIERECGSATDFTRVKIIQHPPSIKLNPEYFEELKRTVNARRNTNVTGLGILVVTPIYGGSLPVARYCASAFEKLGHRVETLDNEIYNDARQQIDQISGNRDHRNQLTGLLNTLMAESITARALDRAVDLVFLTAQSPMTPDVAQELKRHKIPTAFWFVEDWQLFTYWQQWAPLYDYFFTIQKDAFPAALSRIGVNKTMYLPMAADPQVHQPVTLKPEEISEFGSDVSHIGAGYFNRQAVFSGLSDLDFKLWGNGWEDTTSIRKVLQREGDRITVEDSVKIFNASRININLHSSEFHRGVNPDGDFINPRTFEIAACGGFQLTDQRSLLPELFEVGKEITTFKHESELRYLIEHYLQHPEERRSIAANARRRVLMEHTYEMRMAEALNYIYSYETTPASRRHPDHIDNLLEEAENDAELTELLSRFSGTGVVTVDDIAVDIQSRRGEISDPETIFLLMHEFRNWAKEKELF
ncbi:glycosyltransferase [bacterium]|nr:glycosyltransferase [bacterium]